MDAEWFRTQLQDHMQELLAEYRHRAGQISKSSEPLIASIASLVEGGKRLRALLAWWGWQGAGGKPDDARIIDAGVALELFQAAALIHDDILDRSDTRRGQRSVHKNFEKLPVAKQWVKEVGNFVFSPAFLAADLALGLRVRKTVGKGGGVGVGGAW